MRKIAVLDQATIDKIAAGEVVERPASVAKELVENAIDAGATAITVEIRDGGITYMRISDNGCGIPAEQVQMAFLRHATSKITTADDLHHIISLGFRGEALSSIAAVAQVELITKTREDLMGTRYIIEGGVEKSLEEIGAPEGTTFFIRNLFFNTPVRSKFLKTPATEAGYISSIMEQLALSNAGIAFKFVVNGQVKLHTTGSGNLKDVIYSVFGRDIARELLEVQYEQDGISIGGYLAKPTVSRGNRNYESYYVNGRCVKNRVVTKAIEDAYHGFMMQHKYPFTALSIQVQKDIVDVNVHPTKKEVRFSNEPIIYNAVYEAVTQALTHRELIPEATVDVKKAQKKPVMAATSVPEPFEQKRRAEMMQRSTVVSKKTTEIPAAPVELMSVSMPARSMAKYESNSRTSSTLTKEQQKKTESALEQIKEAVRIAEESEKRMMKGSKYTPVPSNNIVRDADAVYGAKVQTPRTNTPAESVEKTAEIPAEKTVEKIAEKPAQKSTETVQPVTFEKPEQMTLFDKKLLAPESRVQHRVIGQLFDTYWLVEFDDKLFIMDQHAAHEKVLYERLMKEYEKKEITSQLLSPPMVITLNMEEETALLDYMDVFHDLGFLIEDFGGRDYTIREIPYNLYGLNSKDLFIEILDGLSEEGSRVPLAMVTDKLATAACKAAVKGNHTLTYQEAESLIDELMTLNNPYQCPHGRPTIISMSKYEIEKKFRRIV